MYAPKFQSWLTDEQRFLMALDYRLGIMAEEAHAEIRRMADEAREALPKPAAPSQHETQRQFEEFLRNNAAAYQHPLASLGMAGGSAYSYYFGQQPAPIWGDLGFLTQR